MASKKPDIKLRIRRDRLDLLKEMHEVLNGRLDQGGGKPISFNRFMEDMVESFLVSKKGKDLWSGVNDRRLARSNGWREERRANAPSEEEWV